MATRLFVGNLSENTNEYDLHTAFSAYGEITNLDIKSKSTAATNDSKKFAFITLSASNHNVESCIQHFTNEEFKGNKVYVTRARESFLERLQREREQAQKKDADKVDNHEHVLKKNPVIKLGDKLNPRKRKSDNHTNDINHKVIEVDNLFEKKTRTAVDVGDRVDNKITSSHISETDKKKLLSDKKRMESMKKKRQEFKEKQMIIKTGLTGIDKVPNKKTIFSDNEEDSPQTNNSHDKTMEQEYRRNNLFDNNDGESDGELNFEIKKQFEGKNGQKVLDLQSRYKSDKRFILDERFVDDESEEEKDKETESNDDKVDLEQTDERDKQLNILQDVLGVSIRRNIPNDDNKKNKPKLGMLRFDPTHPEHAKFLAPVEDPKQKPSKKSKKKSKDNQTDNNKPDDPEPEIEKPEVSKEQFYKVSDTLKEAIAQPNTFSLRSLFANNEAADDNKEQDANFIPLETPKEPKVKNPLNPSERNPFVYDSSDSETDEVKTEPKSEVVNAVRESKAIWKENLFFSKFDNRLSEGLAFFSNFNAADNKKERRELKSLVKRRIYNKERKNQMFQKKIGGRKKSMKKSYRKKS